LHWTIDIPDAIRADYNVSKVDSRLQALANVALSPRGELAAYMTKNIIAYAGAHRLQEKNDSLDDDSSMCGGWQCEFNH